MKKIAFLLVFIAGLSLQAQDLASRFDAKAYADRLSHDIQSALGINDQALAAKIERETYVYAQSIRKYLILFQQQGKLEGKTIEEAVQTVLPEVEKSTHFKKMLSRILGNTKVDRLVSEGIIR